MITGTPESNKLLFSEEHWLFCANILNKITRKTKELLVQYTGAGFLLKRCRGFVLSFTGV